MTPLARISISLVLTLAIWAPSAVGELLGDDQVDLGAVSLRFLVVFVAMRIGMRFIDSMLRRYRAAADLAAQAAAATSIKVDTADVDVMVPAAPQRRRSDGADAEDAPSTELRAAS